MKPRWQIYIYVFDYVAGMKLKIKSSLGMTDKRDGLLEFSLKNVFVFSSQI